MNRLAIGVFWFLAFCALAGSEVTRAQEPSQTEVDHALAAVKSAPTSTLDRGLPETRLEDWLQTQAGPEGRIQWDYQYSTAPSVHMHFVEAVVTFNEDQSFMVSIEVEHGQPLSFESGWVILGRQLSIDLKRPSDLPQALNKLRSESTDREAIR